MVKYNLGDSVYYVEMRSDAAALLEDKYRIIDILDGGENFLLIRDLDMINAAEYPKSNDGDYWDNEYQVIKASRSNIMYEGEVSKLAELIASITLYDYDKDLDNGCSQYIEMRDDIGPEYINEARADLYEFMMNGIHDKTKYNTQSSGTLAYLAKKVTEGFDTIQEFNNWITERFNNGNGFFIKVNGIYHLNMDIEK